MVTEWEKQAQEALKSMDVNELRRCIDELIANGLPAERIGGG